MLTDPYLTVYEDWNSWGYFSLSFRVTSAEGKVFFLRKYQLDWTRNSPTTHTIAPGEKYLLKVDFQPKVWPGIITMKGTKTDFQLKAVFNEPSPEKLKIPMNPDVWAGHVVSSPLLVHIRFPRKLTNPYPGTDLEDFTKIAE